MQKKLDCRNQKGFTLIEIISVMIIMGVVASVSIQKFDIVSDSASERALITGIKELNVRESLVWSNLKISGDGYPENEDVDVWPLVDTDLGPGYKWNPDPPNRETGGTLSFKTASRSLTREVSTQKSAGRWH